MPASEVVVADTSPLLNLALVERLHLVRSQFDSITVPEAVRDELLAGDSGRDALESLLDSEFASIEPPTREGLVREFRSELDAGESAAIALAIERDANVVLIDEREGRQIARRHGLDVTGVVGVVLRAAKEGDIEVEPTLDALRDAGFWIGDDLYRRAIEAVGEDS